MLAQVCRFALTVVSGPILSRLVGPAAYGIVAPAQSMGALGRLLAESGFAYHTVTARTLAPGQAKHLHWQSVRLSVTLALAAGFCAALFTGTPTERTIRAALGFALVLLGGAAAVPIAWAQRNGSLGKLEWWGVPAQAFATFVLAVPAAYLGLGVLAVNLNLVAPLILAFIAAWLLSRLGGVVAQTTIVAARYRWGSLTANFGSYLGGNVDTLLLATYLTPTALGVYSRANLLATLPGTVVSASIARVGLVSLSQSNQWSDQRSFLFKATGATLVAFASLALLAGAGFDVTGFAFGRKFSTPPLGFGLLTLSQVFFYAGSLLDTFLTVRRRLAWVGGSHLLQAALSAAAFWKLKPTDLVSIAWILLIPSALRYGFALIATAKTAGERPIPCA